MSSERTSRQRRPSLYASSSLAAAAAALERGDDLGRQRVDDGLDAADAALGRVVEDHLAVARRWSRAPCASWRARSDSFSTAYSSEPMRKKPRSSSRTAHASTRSRVSSSPLEVGLHVLAQRRQRAGEARHVVELLGVAPGAPGLVVEVLLAAGGVDARRLQVAARVGADPDVLPGGRDARARGSASRTSGSSIGRPSSSRYSKPRPRPRRVIPGPEQSDRRRRAMWHTVFPRARGLGFRTPMPKLEFETTRNGTVAIVAPDRRAGPLRRRRARGRARPPGRGPRARRPWCSTCAGSSSWTRAGCGSSCSPTCGRARRGAGSRWCAATRPCIACSRSRA